MATAVLNGDDGWWLSCWCSLEEPARAGEDVVGYDGAFRVLHGDRGIRDVVHRVRAEGGRTREKKKATEQIRKVRDYSSNKLFLPLLQKKEKVHHFLIISSCIGKIVVIRHCSIVTIA